MNIRKFEVGEFWNIKQLAMSLMNWHLCLSYNTILILILNGTEKHSKNYEQLHANKLTNLVVMGKFLETYKLLKLNEEPKTWIDQ